jgi:hypothetical protein
LQLLARSSAGLDQEAENDLEEDEEDTESEDDDEPAE